MQGKTMKTPRTFPARLASFFLAVALAVFLAAPASAAPGDLDASFVFGVSGSAFATAVQPDGKILVGGSFSGGAGGAAILLARLHADGTLDTSFSPSLNDYQRATAAVLDGIAFVVDRSTDLTGPWIANVPQEILFQDATVQTMEAKHETPATQPLAPQHYMRLRVIRP